MSTLLEADTQTILEVLAKRWAVEVLFEDAKDLLGSDHYQVMRSVAVERFWTLVFCLGYFLDKQRDKLQATPLLGIFYFCCIYTHKSVTFDLLGFL